MATSAQPAAGLRAPFDDDQIGLLPRIYCQACRGQQERGTTCADHTRKRCKGCKSWITEAHLHLSYVGHAHVTERLLDVDPTWHWEPLAYSSTGLPLLDEHGGLWIRLHVLDRSPMLGYGHADGRKHADAVKIAIGDAIRNAAMRLGVALDLWKKEREGDGQPAEKKTTGTGTGERDGLYRSILAIGRRKGLGDKPAVEADFTTGCADRHHIKDAPLPVLAEYLAHLKHQPNGGAQ